ncbi:MAG: hypothetical protein WD270_10520 [Acetobacterales bacterium]
MAADEKPTRAEIEKYAREAGMTNLTSEQMDEFLNAAIYLRGLLKALPRDFALDEEPAHVFRAGPEA